MQKIPDSANSVPIPRSVRTKIFASKPLNPSLDKFNDIASVGFFISRISYHNRPKKILLEPYGNALKDVKQPMLLP